MSTALSTTDTQAHPDGVHDIQLLDNAWLLTLVAVLLATAAPRLLGTADIDAVATAWGVLGLGAIHVIVAAVAETGRAASRWVPPALLTVHASGVLLIGVIWQFAGALQNPAFLLAFVFPVIGATFISRRQPYLTTALSIVVVATVAIRQTPEVRWYVAGLSRAGAWLTTVIGASAGATSPFPGFYAPSGYFVATLAAFVILLCASAVSAEFLGSLLARLRTHANAVRHDLARAEERWLEFIRDFPMPAALVDADTRQVVCGSSRWADLCDRRRARHGTDDLFEMVQFSYPEVVEELLAGDGGVARPCMVRVAGRLRATELRVQHLTLADRRLALVIMADVTETLCMSAALDAADYAFVLIDAKERVIGFNKPTHGLWAEADVGIGAGPLLSKLGYSKGSWVPGLSGRRKSHVEIRGRVYEVRISSIPLPGEADCAYAIAVVPTAAASAESLLTGAQAAAPQR
jgi:hypothetical protein